MYSKFTCTFHELNMFFIEDYATKSHCGLSGGQTFVNISCFAQICENVGGSIPSYLTEVEFDALNLVDSTNNALSSRLFPLDLLYDNEQQMVVKRQTFDVVDKTFWSRVHKSDASTVNFDFGRRHNP